MLMVPFTFRYTTLSVTKLRDAIVIMMSTLKKSATRDSGFGGSAIANSFKGAGQNLCFDYYRSIQDSSKSIVEVDAPKKWEKEQKASNLVLTTNMHR
jgi:hypothetical protein